MWNPDDQYDSFNQPAGPGVLRQMTESAILLAIAVTLFRAFAAEGYLISTGSMAPSLLGYHRQVTCPSCQFHFARGAAFDSDSSSGEIAWANHETTSGAKLPQHPTHPAALTVCPNCGLTDIDASDTPLNEGDQLLVHKHAFQLRDPRRWEVIVFRNPGDQRQAYVKRTIGLPGEHIEIIAGDVYANGKLQRKPYEVQRAIRIPVANYKHQPAAQDPDWQMRWRTVDSESHWTLHDAQLVFNGLEETSQLIDWIAYQHWIRAGGQHESSVALAHWPENLSPPNPRYSNIRFEEQHLFCVGALTDLDRRKWISKTDDAAFHKALNTLFEKSHIAPIVDLYGYNMAGHTNEIPVHDLMASIDLHHINGEGRFEIQLTDGAAQFRLVLDYADQTVELLQDNNPVPVREAPFDGKFYETDTISIDFSLFDSQATVAINEQPLFSAYEYSPSADRQPMTQPLLLGATGLNCVVNELQLYRDVYYTSKSKENEQGEQVYDLDDSQFFVLGDNSPVSVDSRVWEDPAVPRDALIGKPLVVHLPSQQGEFQWGGQTKHIRIPDFTRVRVIR